MSQNTSMVKEPSLDIGPRKTSLVPVPSSDARARTITARPAASKVARLEEDERRILPVRAFLLESGEQ
jgi:hypothetical protein